MTSEPMLVPGWNNEPADGANFRDCCGGTTQQPGSVRRTPIPTTQAYGPCQESDCSCGASMHLLILMV